MGEIPLELYYACIRSFDQYEIDQIASIKLINR